MTDQWTPERIERGRRVYKRFIEAPPNSDAEEAAAMNFHVVVGYEFPLMLKEIERLQENIACLTGNKWSEIELAICENKAQKLWMKLHGIERIDDLRERAEAAEAQVEAMRAVVEAAQRYLNSVDLAHPSHIYDSKRFETPRSKLRKALAALPKPVGG